MAEFSIRSDSVDVEQIMERIRTRIREKRGIDYTEDQIKEIAAVKLDRFLDPKAVRSDLVEQYRRRQPAVPLPPMPTESLPPLYGFETETIYASSRGLSGRIIAGLRRILNPVLKLFFNPNPLIRVLHMQSAINAHMAHLAEQYPAAFERIRQKLLLRDELDALNFEVLNNLVVEMTRVGIEVKNLKMRVESLSSRLDFDERRARALESAVQYRPEAPPGPGAGTSQKPAGAASVPTGQESVSARRRRRRRGRQRRPGAPGQIESAGMTDAIGESGQDSSPAQPDRPAPEGPPPQPDSGATEP